MVEKYTGPEQRRVPRTLVSEISFKLFGKVSFAEGTQVYSHTGTTILVPANPNRISMILTNNSASDIYFSLKPDVSATNGLLLAANGGSFSIKVKDEGEMVIHEWYSIAGADDLPCTLIESVLQED